MTRPQMGHTGLSRGDGCLRADVDAHFAGNPRGAGAMTAAAAGDGETDG